MNEQYINAFLSATKDVFNLMLDINPERKNIKLVDGIISSKDANILLGITGDLRGSILFGFNKEMTLEMVKSMSGMEMEEIDGFVSSVLGELANIIGGHTTTNLTKNNYICDIVPPEIFVGQYKSYSMASDKALSLLLETPMGQFDVILNLKENK
ncbi:chemotaxis protein CheX [Natranaerovirga hydrolytica]|uniref:Chemotaxis protein CheX n=1 Tax=Natranaerovirga hydrolytica TaxID=680378 RepID=A0A4R1MZU0_9FIRM|nr:chemotaxis protein CheX [Natranaerovirga hydrolytica]TCK98715.1 chemotaxis protein CheX [Natranaerovirga hydrolytica]